MSRDYVTHWIIGVLCALIWFWGGLVGIPPEAIALAASVVPAALADAMRKSSDTKTTLKSNIADQIAVAREVDIDYSAAVTDPVVVSKSPTQIGVNTK